MNGANPLVGSENLAHNIDHFYNLTEYSIAPGAAGSAGFQGIEPFALKLYVFWKNPFNYVGPRGHRRARVRACASSFGCTARRCASCRKRSRQSASVRRGSAPGIATEVCAHRPALSSKIPLLAIPIGGLHRCPRRRAPTGVKPSVGAPWRWKTRTTCERNPGAGGAAAAECRRARAFFSIATAAARNGHSGTCQRGAVRPSAWATCSHHLARRHDFLRRQDEGLADRRGMVAASSSPCTRSRTWMAWR